MCVQKLSLDCECIFYVILCRYGCFILDSKEQADSDADVVFVEDSPPADENEEKSNDEVVANETAMSPANSENSSHDDKCSLIEISDESNHSTATKLQSKL